MTIKKVVLSSTEYLEVLLVGIYAQLTMPQLLTVMVQLPQTTKAMQSEPSTLFFVKH